MRSFKRALRALWLPVSIGLLIASDRAVTAFWNASDVSERLRRGALRTLWLPIGIGLVLASAGAASAFWNSSGVGAGGGVTGTALPVVLTPGSPAAQLRPGGTADANLTMTNPNGFSVTIGSLVLDATHGTGGFAVDSSHAACTPSSLGFINATTGWTVPAKIGSTDGTLDVVLSHSVSMASSAPDACQGVHVSVYLRAAS